MANGGEMQEMREMILRLIQLQERTEVRTNRILDGIERLAEMVRNHELRIEHLEEGNRGKVQ